MSIASYGFLFLVIVSLCFVWFSLFKLESEKQKKFIRLFDEMYRYFKNINKGE